MSKYLEITNDNGVVIIDDELARLRISRSFLLSTCTEETPMSGLTGDNTIASIKRYTIPLQTNELSIAIKPNLYNDTAGFSVELDSDNNQCIVYVFLSGYEFDASKYKILVLGNITSTTSPGWSGLEVYDENGNIVFNGLYDYLNIVDSFAFQFPYDFDCFSGIPIQSESKTYSDVSHKAYVINSIAAHTVRISAHGFLDGPEYYYTYYPCYFTDSGLLVTRRYYALFQRLGDGWHMIRRVGALGSATEGFVLNTTYIH
jgi:hypothetical protein